MSHHDGDMARKRAAGVEAFLAQSLGFESVAEFREWTSVHCVGKSESKRERTQRMTVRVGDIVHFVCTGGMLGVRGDHLAAVVTAVIGRAANLQVFFADRNGSAFLPNVGQDEAGKDPGTWHRIEGA